MQDPQRETAELHPLPDLFELIQSGSPVINLPGPCVGDDGAPFQVGLGPCVGDDNLTPDSRDTVRLKQTLTYPASCDELIATLFEFSEKMGVPVAGPCVGDDSDQSQTFVLQRDH